MDDKFRTRMTELWKRKPHMIAFLDLQGFMPYHYMNGDKINHLLERVTISSQKLLSFSVLWSLSNLIFNMYKEVVRCLTKATF